MTRDRATTIFFLALSGAALVARPLAHGIPGATITAFWAVALGQVLLPGVLLIRGARLGGGGDPWALLGQGATIGLALQAVAFLAGRALGLPWLTTAAAVAAGAIGIVLGGRQSGEAPAAAPPASPWTLAVMLGALLVLPLNSAARIGEPVPFDLLFHSGTAGELRHRWPLQDPRVAGVPLHYHVLSCLLDLLLVHQNTAGENERLCFGTGLRKTTIH